MAEMFLATGQFVPDYPSDVWAFGMLLAMLLHADLPHHHLHLLTSPAFRHGNPTLDPRTQPGFKAVLEYMAGLLRSDTSYAAQVPMQTTDGTCRCGSLKPAAVSVRSSSLIALTYSCRSVRVSS